MKNQFFISGLLISGLYYFIFYFHIVVKTVTTLPLAEEEQEHRLRHVDRQANRLPVHFPLQLHLGVVLRKRTYFTYMFV